MIYLTTKPTPFIASEAMNVVAVYMNVINILILEDHPVAARGLSEFVKRTFDKNFEVHVEFGNLKGKSIPAQFPPDLVIVGLNPRPVQPDVFDQFRKRYEWNNRRVIIYCDRTEFRVGIEYLYRGVAGFVLKESEPAELEQCCKKLLDGQPYVCQKAVQKILAHFMPGSDMTGTSADRDFPLTPRELEIAREISRGLRVTEIARRLKVTPGRVSICKASIYKKLDVKDHHDLTTKLFELSIGRKDT